jgi:hypothetical protein
MCCLCVEIQKYRSSVKLLKSLLKRYGGCSSQNDLAVCDTKYRAFHNVLRDYKHLEEENQRTYPNGILLKNWKSFFSLTTRDVRCVNICWRTCGSNLNIVSMCAVSPVVHTSNTSSCQKKLFQFSCSCEKFYYGRSFGFLVINVCNHGEHYETPCILLQVGDEGSNKMWFYVMHEIMWWSRSLERLAFEILVKVIARFMSTEIEVWFSRQQSSVPYIV